MSSIRKRGKVWVLDLRFDDRRIRESLDTSDKRVASIKAKIRERELKQDGFSKPIGLHEFIEEYLVWAESHKAKETIRVERSCLKRLEETLEIKRLDQLTVKRADWFIAKIAKEKASPHGSKKKSEKPMTPSGVNYYIRTLRSIFSAAVRWNYLGKNPFSEVGLLKVELDQPRILSQREIASLIMTTKHHYPEMVDLFHFYLLTGLRRSEALRLQWTDVDFDRNILIVRKTKGKRVRLIPLIPRARQILEARRELKMPFDFKPDYVTDKFMNAAKKAGIVAELHDLRRTFGSYR